METFTLWLPAQDTLTWILCLGAHISTGQEERRWFVSWLAKTVRLRKIYTWDGLRALLLRYFYLDSAYRQSLMGVWDEVQLAMKF